MEDLIKTILELTEKMEQTLNQNNHQEFDQLLAQRNEWMQKVDEYRAGHPEEEYSSQAKQMLEIALQADRRMEPILNQRISETESTIIRIKNTKKVSKRYQPYINQTNGVFIDSKK